MTHPNPEAQIFSGGVYLYHHLEGEHASENIVEIPQDLEDTRGGVRRRRGAAAGRGGGGAWGGWAACAPVPETCRPAPSRPRRTSTSGPECKRWGMQGGRTPRTLLEPHDPGASPWPFLPLGQISASRLLLIPQTSPSSTSSGPGILVSLLLPTPIVAPDAHPRDLQVSPLPAVELQLPNYTRHP